jgi:hypothetical protein
MKSMPPLHISASAVPRESVTTGVTQQRLLSGRQSKDTRVLIDRFAVAGGASWRFDVPAGSIIWVQVLDGVGTLRTPYTTVPLTESVSFTLPAGIVSTLSTDKGVSFMQTEIVDLGAAADATLLRATDWRNEWAYSWRHA